MRLAVLVVAVIGAVCGVAAATPTIDVDVALMKRLDIYWGTQGSYPSDPTLTREDRMRRFFHERVQSVGFYDAVLPRMFESLSNMEVNPPFRDVLVLQHDGADEYLSRGQTCKKAERVPVHPWWELPITVRVCKADYQPELVIDPAIKDRTFCESAMAGSCGCGQNLMSCAKDDAQYDAVVAASRNEMVYTFARIMREHLPFSQVLTTNATVRTDLGDFLYARAETYAGHPFTWAKHSDTPTLRPRPEAFQGGVLTMPYTLWLQDVARRVMMSRIWSDFLCTPLRSSNVNAHQMFEIDDPRLRSRSHMELAGKNGCRDCHSRLENAFQATSGFTSYAGFRFVAADVSSSTSALYVRDANDKRAEGESSPAWLGRTLAMQPEFGACMVDKAERFFYADDTTPPATHARLQALFVAQQDFGALLEAAFLARYGGDDNHETRR